MCVCVCVCVWCVCVCVCLSVCPLSHISPLGLLFVLKTQPRTQLATKVKKYVAFSLELLLCRDRALPPFDGYICIRSAICPADNTHAYCAYAKFSKVRDVMLSLHAVSFPCVLCSFMTIILGLESFSYSCVSCWLSVCTRVVVLLYS